MAQAGAEQLPVPSSYACFPDAEWKLLQDWQKELYQNVMKEIHQALISLGPIITTAVLSLRGKEASDLCSLYSQEPEVKHGDLIHDPGSFFAIKNTQSADPGHDADAEAQEKNPCIKRDEEPVSIFIDHLGEEFQERTADPAPRDEIISFCIKDEDVPYGMEQSSSKRRGPKKKPGDARDILEVVVVDIKEEDKEISSTYHQECDVNKRFFNTTGSNSTGIQKKVRKSRQRATTIASSTDALKEQNMKVPQYSQHGPTSRRQPCYENNMAMKSKKMAQHESGSSNLDCSSKHPRKTNGLHSSTSLPSPDYRVKSEPAEDVESDTEVSLFTCTICEKAFFQMKQLTEHYRTHTGEKPHVCPICHRCFSRKDNLKGHIRVHTRERPYECGECGLTFIWKSHLNAHRKKKHIP